MTPTIQVDSLRCVYSDVNHNAFTDLVEFQGAFYLSFRSNPVSHLAHPGTLVHILKSADGVDWTEVYSFETPGKDLRDPHFVVLNDQLFAYSGFAFLEDVQNIGRQFGYGVSSSDGEHWSEPTPLGGTDGRFVWSAVEHEGKAYIGTCRKRDFDPESGPHAKDLAYQWSLMESEDGLTFRQTLDFPQDGGVETGFLFEDDGTVLAIIRIVGPRPHHAVFWRAQPPYTEWTHTVLHRFIGGPMLMKWGNRYLVGGRRFDGDQTSGTDESNTSVGWLEGLGPGETPHLVEGIDLPSGGDTSYTGFVALSDTEGLLSYYSSHEGSGTRDAPASIYVARLRLG
jgi:hypothetical protein